MTRLQMVLMLNRLQSNVFTVRDLTRKSGLTDTQASYMLADAHKAGLIKFSPNPTVWERV